MNWTLVFALSLFGLAMGVATVFVIPSNVEPFFWLAIFVVCAYLIATRSQGRYFLHGFLLSLVNSVWITASHVALFTYYIDNHPQEVAMMRSMPFSDAPRLMMAITGPVIGVLSGVVLGLFALVAHLLVRRGRPVAPPR